MTERKWLNSADPAPMLLELTEASPRKLRLFAVACCRRLLRKDPDEGAQQLLDLTERDADGRAGAGELSSLKNRLFDLRAHVERRVSAVRQAANEAASSPPWQAARRARSFVIDAFGERGGGAARACERAAQADLLRDVFGNPFRLVVLEPAWTGPDILALAARIYEERDFDALPVLADALRDAGCTEEALLGHLLAQGPHVRGCWALDLLLGKE